jgi:hypothetical protein
VGPSYLAAAVSVPRFWGPKTTKAAFRPAAEGCSSNLHRRQIPRSLITIEVLPCIPALSIAVAVIVCAPHRPRRRDGPGCPGPRRKRVRSRPLHRAVWFAAGSLGVVIALRAASWRDPVARAPVPTLYVPTRMTPVYNQAKGSPCALGFPYRRGGRLGRRRGERMHGRGCPALGRRDHFARYPAVDARDRGNFRIASAPLRQNQFQSVAFFLGATGRLIGDTAKFRVRTTDPFCVRITDSPPLSLWSGAAPPETVARVVVDEVPGGATPVIPATATGSASRTRSRSVPVDKYGRRGHTDRPHDVSQPKRNAPAQRIAANAALPCIPLGDSLQSCDD